ncbi:MAG: hypothetical protein IH840_13120 [Candidatus Heimdallarchaeota archaeon]|nr:hypothetical protein [Candidatus Heimdallarchaeota archaeon]
MEDRINVLNQLIGFDKGYAGHDISANALKIDYFCEDIKNYLTAGVAFLEGKIDPRKIPSSMYDSLKNLLIRLNLGLIRNERRLVTVGGLPNDQNRHCDCLTFGDGTHRTIISLHQRKKNQRYFEITNEINLKKLDTNPYNYDLMTFETRFQITKLKIEMSILKYRPLALFYLKVKKIKRRLFRPPSILDIINPDYDPESMSKFDFDWQNIEN